MLDFQRRHTVQQNDSLLSLHVARRKHPWILRISMVNDQTHFLIVTCFDQQLQIFTLVQVALQTNHLDAELTAEHCLQAIQPFLATGYKDKAHALTGQSGGKLCTDARRGPLKIAHSHYREQRLSTLITLKNFDEGITTEMFSPKFT